MGDVQYTTRLMVCRDVYGCHFKELSPDRRAYLNELVALSMLEKELSQPDPNP